jgi:hypothetical protein
MRGIDRRERRERAADLHFILTLTMCEAIKGAQKQDIVEAGGEGDRKAPRKNTAGRQARIEIASEGKAEAEQVECRTRGSLF